LLGAQQAKDILARCGDVLATGELSALVAAIEDVCREPITRPPRG
jgi:hypothetical protein